jgi:cobalamin biosynthesis protein CbiD
LEDSSKALSYIGIEVADALKLIPTPEEQLEAIAEENAMEEATVKTETMAEKGIAELIEDNVAKEEEQYVQETTFEAKPSLWQRFKNSKIVRAATYIFRIKIRIELPNALPEGRGE